MEQPRLLEINQPQLIRGNHAVNDRGVVGFVNDFDFQLGDVRRFYTIENHRVGFVRAWHGHRHEAKYMFCVHGSVLVCAVPLDEMESGYLAHPYRQVLAASKPAIYYVPPGYANGTMGLTEGAKVMHFSTLRLGERPDDDVRYPATMFAHLWEVQQR